MSVPDETAAEAKKSRHFRPRQKPMDRSHAERQGRITHLALAALGGPAQAMNFLNSHHEALGGRPLELATNSAEGFLAVQTVIQDSAAAGSP